MRPRDTGIAADYLKYVNDLLVILGLKGIKGVRACLKGHPLPPYSQQTHPVYLVDEQNRTRVEHFNAYVAGINSSANDGTCETLESIYQEARKLVYGD